MPREGSLPPAMAIGKGGAPGVLAEHGDGTLVEGGLHEAREGVPEHRVDISLLKYMRYYARWSTKLPNYICTATTYHV
jgi:hypothetical protein